MKGMQCHSYDEAFSTLRTNFSRSGVSPEFIDEITEGSIDITFEKGALIFVGAPAHDLLGCLLAGYVKIYCAVGDGRRTLVRLAGPGELIGYPDYIDSKGRRARLFEAQSASKCEVGFISREHLARLLKRLDASALVEILQALNTFWSQNLSWTVKLLNLSFAERLKAVLSDLAQRAGVKDARGITLIPEPAHEDLAEMIGCSRPMVSRLLAEMAEDELLTRVGKQYLLLNKWQVDAKPELAPVKIHIEAGNSKNGRLHKGRLT